MKHVLLFTCLMLVVSDLILAQITITSSGIAPSGTSWTYHSTGGNTEVVIPAGGPDQVWNVPEFGFGYHIQTQYVNPAGTPYDTAFPSATNCMYMMVGNSGTYAYMQAANGEFRQLGIGQGISGTPVWHYNPTSLIMPLPLTYPHDPWLRVFEYSYTLIPGFISTIRDSSEIILDGWGTLTTQYGNFQVLRTRERHWITEYLNGSVSAHKQNVSYAWFDHNGVTILSFTSPTDSINFTLATVTEAEYAASGIAQNENIPGKFFLEQNYPNPFNPATRITYSVPEASFVNITVFDLLGNEIAVLVNEEKDAGRHEIEFIPENRSAGIYFYRLKADNFSETRKMILLK